MTPEQAARLADIVARVVRGEPGASRELMDESRTWVRWSCDPDGAILVTSDGSSSSLYGSPVRAAEVRGRLRRDLEGLTLDEAKARITAEFEARGYVVLP